MSYLLSAYYLSCCNLIPRLLHESLGMSQATPACASTSCMPFWPFQWSPFLLAAKDSWTLWLTCIIFLLLLVSLFNCSYDVTRQFKDKFPWITVSMLHGPWNRIASQTQPTLIPEFSNPNVCFLQSPSLVLPATNVGVRYWKDMGTYILPQTSICMRHNYEFIPNLDVNYTLSSCNLNSSMHSDSMQQSAISLCTYSCVHCELASCTQTFNYMQQGIWNLSTHYLLKSSLEIRFCSLCLFHAWQKTLHGVWGHAPKQNFRCFEIATFGSGLTSILTRTPSHH